MIKCIVCTDRAWGIGKANGLLFDIPADMKFFRETTRHNIVVMGYNTYLSLPKKPLPNRVNIILWDKATSLDCIPGCITFNTFEPLLNFVKVLSKEYDVFISGGGSIYKLFLPYYDEVLVTYVDASDQEATVFFPNLDMEENFIRDGLTHCAFSGGYDIEFRKYIRRK